MKTLLTLLALLLASCASIDTAEETGHHLDSLRGMASGKRDAEMMRFADAIIAKAGKREVDDSGTLYPGTVKVIRWESGGVEKYTALRLSTWPDGSQAWQGPTPSSGFYGAKLRTEYLH